MLILLSIISWTFIFHPTKSTERWAEASRGWLAPVASTTCTASSQRRSARMERTTAAWP